MFNPFKPSWASLMVSALSLLDCVVNATPVMKKYKHAVRRTNYYSQSVFGVNSKTISNGNSTANWKYSNPKTKKYQVLHIPGINFDYGELYSGLMPTANSSDRALFYVFNPSINKSSKDLVIWLNGGPGCSSMEGFLQENGPFSWKNGEYPGLPNPYSWTNLTNMLWVEYPVGTGFSIGKITANSQEEIAKDFIGFFKNFQEAFGISNYKIFVTGESYAGKYVPYVASAMMDQKDKKHFDISGIIVYDPTIGALTTGQKVSTYPFVNKNQAILGFNDTFVKSLEKAHKECGYADYYEKYLSFPPPGPQPTTKSDTRPECKIWANALIATKQTNPCFNAYYIADICPRQVDPLGFPNGLVSTGPGNDWPFFNRRAVKEAMHAPLDHKWAVCQSPVFAGPNERDRSAPSIHYVLPRVIEHTNRVMIGNGDYDFRILNDGTLLSIQNMTWNGHLGFQKKPQDDVVINLSDLLWTGVYVGSNGTSVDGLRQGVMGTQHYERGLMWTTTKQAGHMVPEYQPSVAYRHLLWLLGMTEKI